MTTVEPTRPGLVERARNILLQPGAEWDRIKGETTPLPALLMGYVLPLAVIAAVCGAIGMAFFGIGVGFGPFSVAVKTPIVSAVVDGVLRVVFTVVGVFLLGLLINALAPSFGSTQDQAQAHKLAAYSVTASLLAGVFAIFPPIAILGILGLYSLALLYIGLPRLMNTPEDKRIGYFATILIIWIVGALVIGWAVAAARVATTGFGLPGMAMNAPGAAPDARITLPGGVTIDTRQTDQAAKRMEKALADAQSGSATPIDLARLSALLPAELPGGFRKEESSSQSTGAMGINAGIVEAVYVNGDRRIRITITDMGAVGAFAGMAAAMGVQSSRETATGYERTQTKDGRVITEEVDRAANTAHYQVVTSNRVAVSAEATGVNVEALRAVVNTLVGRAEAIARSG